MNEECRDICIIYVLKRNLALDSIGIVRTRYRVNVLFCLSCTWQSWQVASDGILYRYLGKATIFAALTRWSIVSWLPTSEPEPRPITGLDTDICPISRQQQPFVSTLGMCRDSFPRVCAQGVPLVQSQGDIRRQERVPSRHVTRPVSGWVSSQDIDDQLSHRWYL